MRSKDVADQLREIAQSSDALKRFEEIKQTPKVDRQDVEDHFQKMTESREYQEFGTFGVKDVEVLVEMVGQHHLGVMQQALIVQVEKQADRLAGQMVSAFHCHKRDLKRAFVIGTTAGIAIGSIITAIALSIHPRIPDFSEPENSAIASPTPVPDSSESISGLQ